mmetsp:Transcript_17290/g.23769  ORF Transcript_17290/g.23769 Transcript_17290/m.23769 type:complete len:205 (+) Transcript_17290:189-803(+)
MPGQSSTSCRCLIPSLKRATVGGKECLTMSMVELSTPGACSLLTQWRLQMANLFLWLLARRSSQLVRLALALAGPLRICLPVASAAPRIAMLSLTVWMWLLTHTYLMVLNQLWGKRSSLPSFRPLKRRTFSTFPLRKTGTLFLRILGHMHLHGGDLMPTQCLQRMSGGVVARSGFLAQIQTSRSGLTLKAAFMCLAMQTVRQRG